LYGWSAGSLSKISSDLIREDRSLVIVSILSFSNNVCTQLPALT
jgi:hypothetical protein